jgi:hypothetical protein
MASTLNLRAVARRSTLATLVALVAGFTGSAFAATRFASPQGMSTPSPCTSAAVPCSLAAALTSAQGSDNLSLAAGTYDVSAVQLPPVPLHWIATDPRSRPVLTSSAAAPTLTLTPAQSGSSFDGLEIDNTSTTGTILEPAMLLLSGVDAAVRTSVVKGRECIAAPGTGTVTIEGSTLSATSPQTCLQLGAMSTVRNSTVSRPSAMESRESPPPVASTAGVVEDTTITGGLDLTGPAAVARRVRASGPTAISGEGLVVDSLAVGAGPDGAAIDSNALQGGTLRVVGSTALNQNGPALLASPSFGPPDPVAPNDLQVTDSIARGAVADIEVNDRFAIFLGGGSFHVGQIEIDHSDFATRIPLATVRDASLITVGPGNVSGDPLFADPATGDFHLRAGSPAIDAGFANALASPTDLDGRPRVQGRAPDIGAFESTPTPVGGPHTPPPPGQIKPVLSNLRVHPGAIHLAHTRRASRRRPATITFTLSQGATVRLSFARAMRNGRLVSAGSVTVRGRRGATTVVFPSALVGRRPLAPGTYRLTATPAGAGRGATARLTVRAGGGSVSA